MFASPVRRRRCRRSGRSGRGRDARGVDPERPAGYVQCDCPCRTLFVYQTPPPAGVMYAGRAAWRALRAQRDRGRAAAGDVRAGARRGRRCAARSGRVEGLARADAHPAAASCRPLWSGGSSTRRRTRRGRRSSARPRSSPSASGYARCMNASSATLGRRGHCVLHVVRPGRGECLQSFAAPAPIGSSPLMIRAVGAPSPPRVAAATNAPPRLRGPRRAARPAPDPSTSCSCHQSPLDSTFRRDAGVGTRDAPAAPSSFFSRSSFAEWLIQQDRTDLERRTARASAGLETCVLSCRPESFSGSPS